MDTFKAIMHSRCGVGGLHCFCCNNFGKGKKKAKLRRTARRKMKGEINESRDS